GFGLMSTEHLARAANCSGTMTQEAVVVSSLGAYFSLATKLMVPGPAASIGAGMKRSTSPSPRNSRPNFDAISLSFTSAAHAQRHQSFKCFFRFNLAQAIVVAEAAGAREAWAAFQMMPNHAAIGLSGTGAKRVGRAENGHGRNPKGSGEMHASGVVADKRR